MRAEGRKEGRKVSALIGALFPQYFLIFTVKLLFRQVMVRQKPINFPGRKSEVEVETKGGAKTQLGATLQMKKLL